MCAYLTDLCFFLSLKIVSLLCFLNVKGVLCSSPPPPSCSECSYSSVCWELDSLTSSASVCSFSARTFAAHTSSVATLVASSFLFYLANSHAVFYASSLHFYAFIVYTAIVCTVELSTPLLVPRAMFVGSRQFGGQLPTISCTFVSKNKYGNFYQIYLVSFLTLIETLWKSALNSAKTLNCSNKVGENLSRWLITI